MSTSSDDRAAAEQSGAQPDMVAVVDDDEPVRRAVVRLLRAAGFRSRGFASGQEFLASMLTDPPAFLLVDLQMPGISGLDVQRRLGEAGARLPTIVMTAHDDPNVYLECMREGASAYLRKPLEQQALLDAVAGARAGPPAQRTPKFP
jgi:FixJ family two-component response regulator